MATHLSIPTKTRKIPFSVYVGRDAAVVVIRGGAAGRRGELALKPHRDGIWHATLRLEPGRYRYQIYVDGRRWTPAGESSAQDLTLCVD